MVSDLASLKASVATFASSCANKLRGQHAAAKAVTVYLRSNRFRDDLEQYNNSGTWNFITPTSDTMEITRAALKIVEQIYRPGILYKKSGVIVSEITDSRLIQHDLFDSISNRKERAELMETIDHLNHRFGLKSIQLAVEGVQKQAWKVKCEHRSSNYLTDLNEILTIHI